jgi:chloramphenicol 3-O phosphotransferase
MRRACVVVLNGVGSVGKSSTARALQTIAARPLLHVAMDQFIEMAPPRLFGTEDGLRFEPGVSDGRPSVGIATGPAFERLMSGMRGAIAAMAAAGNDLVVDDVWDGEEAEYRRLLIGHELRLVGLFAPLEVIEAREAARGDRELGLARWQYGRVHRGVAYDLEIDMTTKTPDEAAAAIRDAFGL